MSLECITLSSDSSRPSSPDSDELPNGKINTHRILSKNDGTHEGFRNYETFLPNRGESKLFSLSDSESDSSFKDDGSQGISPSSIKANNLDDMNILRKRKVTENISAEERKRKKTLKLVEKETLKATKEFQRSLQPGECMKFVTAVIEPKLLQFESMKNIEIKLKEKEVKFAIRPHNVQGIVVWEREIIGIQRPKDGPEEEEHVLLCLRPEDINRLVSDDMLISHVSSIRDFLPKKFITLVLCGMEEYFKSTKHKRNDSCTSSQPKVSRKVIEESLVHIQICFGIGHRVVENSSEFVSLIVLFTKAVAETPFKRDKQERETGGVLNWFARGDSKDCVRVTSSGDGCLLLWQQQLRQFNNVGLDVARAVASSYSSPQALLTAYKKCQSVEAAEKLLQNIPVNRKCGPLSSIRKLGPELSRKIYIYFTSVTGNQFLSGS